MLVLPILISDQHPLGEGPLNTPDTNIQAGPFCCCTSITTCPSPSPATTSTTTTTTITTTTTTNEAETPVGFEPRRENITAVGPTADDGTDPRTAIRTGIIVRK